MKRGRVIPAGRKPRYCPDCDGSMVKAGVRGWNGRTRQAWRCRNCNATTIYPKMEPKAVV